MTSEDNEYIRKKELQDRAFLQWVSKKNEEERVSLVGYIFRKSLRRVYVCLQARKRAFRQQQEILIEQQKQKLLMGKAAYAQWMKTQREKDILLSKQKQRENGAVYLCQSCAAPSHMPATEQRILQEQQRREDQRKSEESYDNWKRQKDLEQKLMIASSIPAEAHPKCNACMKESLIHAYNIYQPRNTTIKQLT